MGTLNHLKTCRDSCVALRVRFASRIGPVIEMNSTFRAEFLLSAQR